jgi:hypothetical protein
MAAAQTGHDLAVTMLVEVFGVVLFTIMAGMNDDLGSVLVVIMWGLFLGWCLMNTTQLGEMVKNL